MTAAVQRNKARRAAILVAACHALLAIWIVARMDILSASALQHQRTAIEDGGLVMYGNTAIGIPLFQRNFILHDATLGTKIFAVANFPAALAAKFVYEGTGILLPMTVASWLAGLMFIGFSSLQWYYIASRIISRGRPTQSTT